MAGRALITGAQGFTGHYLITELNKAGYEVFGLGHTFPQSGKTPDVKNMYTCDLCDTKKLDYIVAEVQPTVVVHLAAISFVAHDNTENIYRTNLVGSRNLFESLAKYAQSLQSVLVASSANVYGNSTSGILNETTPLDPANDYAVSKIAMEYVAKLYRSRLPITIARPFNYTGIGQSEKFLLPKIIAHIRRKAPVIELGNLQIARDFSDVRVVVQYYRRLLENPAANGQIVNICSGKSFSLEEILVLVKSIAGYDFNVYVNPAFIRENEVKVLCGNPSKVESIVGKIPAIPLIETLRWMSEVSGN